MLHLTATRWRDSLRIAAAVLLVSAPSVGGAQCVPPPTPPAGHLALMQLSLSNPAERQAHGARVAMLWSDQEYRPRIGGVYALKYMMDDREPGAEHDTNWYVANHPDWVARKCDGSPAQEFSYSNGFRAPLDIRNPAVRAYLLNSNLGKVLHTGRFDGVAVDNLSGDNTWARCGVLTSSGFRRDFTGVGVDPAFSAAQADWMRWLRLRVNAAGLCLAGNNYFSDDNPQGFLQIASALDIVVDEHGFTRNNRPLSLDAAWRTRMETYLSLPPGKPLVIIDYPAATQAQLSNTGLSWAIANFLMVKRANSYLSLTTLDGFDKWTEISALDIPIGAPLEAMHETGGLYSRRFEHVIAVVNPSSQRAASMTLPTGEWRDLDGQPDRGALTLGPATALVLSAAR